MSTKQEQILDQVSKHLREEIILNTSVTEIPAGTEILREGQYIKVIPLVLSGLIKVYTRHDGRELLLYYIQPNESCIMSFAASLKNEPSKIYAVTEEDTKALLLPVEKVEKWTHQFPDINILFFNQFNIRYSDLLDTINHLLFNKLDERLYSYLKEKMDVTGKSSIKISHRQIANELGTAREVISRTLKKLETEKLIEQDQFGIKIK